MIKIAPSVLGADLSRVAEQVAVVEQAGAQYLHLDVMDGAFVPNISFGPAFIKKLRPHTKLFFDAHLMVNEPSRFVADFADAGVDLVTVHQEACLHLHRTIQEIKAAGMKAGVALNPATPVSVLEEILPELDMVTLMSVNPGFCGQKFIPTTLTKINKLLVLKQQLGITRPLDIQVDGGVCLANIGEIAAAGANVLVAAAAVFGAPDIGQAVRDLEQAAGKRI